ncbi:hypothetical protein BJ165DRAFT_1320068, partial [Panaeolus papilionaceus]
CCDVDNFRMVLYGSSYLCAWNQSAARVFARDFVKHYRLDITELETIQKRFLVRVASLHKEYKRKLLPQHQQQSIVQHDRRQKRQRGVRTCISHFSPRYFTVKHHPHLQQFEPTMKALDWSAMSGDESDSNPSCGTCYVVKPLWRSSVMTHVLHGLDTL